MKWQPAPKKARPRSLAGPRALAPQPRDHLGDLVEGRDRGGDVGLDVVPEIVLEVAAHGVVPLAADVLPVQPQRLQGREQLEATGFETHDDAPFSGGRTGAADVRYASRAAIFRSRNAQARGSPPSSSPFNCPDGPW